MNIIYIILLGMYADEFKIKITAINRMRTQQCWT